MASEEKDVSSRPRKSSSRRSSILKLPKSPSRNILNDMDLNSAGDTEETENLKSFGKKGRKSRRVSFAETFQVKEFIKDNGGTQGPNWTTNESSDSSVGNSTEKCISNAGLESLLTGAIENEVPLSSVQHQVLGSSTPTTPNNTSVCMDMTLTSNGDIQVYNGRQGQESDKTDSKTFLKNLCIATNNSGNQSSNTSIMIPERKHSPTKTQNSYYETERKVDLETIIYTSVNKYLCNTTSNTRESFLNLDHTKIFDDPMEMTGMHTVNLQYADSKQMKNQICNATWANETTKVYEKSVGDIDAEKTGRMDFTECVGRISPAKGLTKTTLNALSSTKIFDPKGDDDDFVFSPNLSTINKIDKHTVLFDSDEEDMEITAANENISMMFQTDVSILCGSNDVLGNSVKQKIDSQAFLKNIMCNSATSSSTNTKDVKNRTVLMSENMDMTECVPQNISELSNSTITKPSLGNEENNETKVTESQDFLKNTMNIGSSTGKTTENDETCLVSENMELKCATFFEKSGLHDDSTCATIEHMKNNVGDSLFNKNKSTYVPENMEMTKCSDQILNIKGLADFTQINSPVKKLDSKSFLSSLIGNTSNASVVDNNPKITGSLIGNSSNASVVDSNPKITGSLIGNSSVHNNPNTIEPNNIDKAAYRSSVSPLNLNRGERLNPEYVPTDTEFGDVVIAEADSSNIKCTGLPIGSSTSSCKNNEQRKGLSDITHVFNADDTVADMEPTMCVGKVEVHSNPDVQALPNQFVHDYLSLDQNLGEIEETVGIGGIVTSAKNANKSVCFNLEENTVHNFDIIESQLSLDHLEEMIAVVENKETEKSSSSQIKVTSQYDKTILFDNNEDLMEETCVNNIIPSNLSLQSHFRDNVSDMQSKVASINCMPTSMKDANDSQSKVKMYNMGHTGNINSKNVESEERIFQEKLDSDCIKDVNKTIIYTNLNKTSSAVEETVCVGGIVGDGGCSVENLKPVKLLEEKVVTTHDKTVFFSKLSESFALMEETGCTGGLLERNQQHNTGSEFVATNPQEDSVNDIMDEQEPFVNDVSLSDEPVKNETKRGLDVHSAGEMAGINTLHGDIDKTHNYQNESTSNMEITEAFSQKNPKVVLKEKSKDGYCENSSSVEGEDVNKMSYIQNNNDTEGMEFTTALNAEEIKGVSSDVANQEVYDDKFENKARCYKNETANVDITQNLKFRSREIYDDGSVKSRESNMPEDINKTKYFQSNETAAMDFTAVVNSCSKHELAEVSNLNLTKVTATDLKKTIDDVNKTTYFQGDNTAAMDFTSVMTQSPLQALKARLGKRRSVIGLKEIQNFTQEKNYSFNKDIVIDEKSNRTQVFSPGKEQAFMDLTSCATVNLQKEPVDRTYITAEDNLNDSLPLLSTTLGLRNPKDCATIDSINQYTVVKESCKDSAIARNADLHLNDGTLFKVTELTQDSDQSNIQLTSDSADVPNKKLRLSSQEDAMHDTFKKPQDTVHNEEKSENSQANNSKHVSRNSAGISFNKSTNSGLNTSTFSSVGSKSMLDFLQPTPSIGHSVAQISLIEDLSHYQPKSVEDYVKLFGVWFNERKIRHSTMAPVSVRPIESISDALQQVIYEPQLETYEWACEQLNSLSEKCKEMTSAVEEGLLKSLPEILKNEPGDPETVQKMTNMKTLSRKKARSMFKNWQCKMLKNIGHSLKQETLGLQEGAKEVTVATSQIDNSIERLRQVYKDLEVKKRTYLKKMEERFINIERVKEKEKEKKGIDSECHCLEKERTELSVVSSKLQDRLASLKDERNDKSGRLERHNKIVSKKIDTTLNHMNCILYTDIVKWNSNEAEFSVIENYLVLNIKFGQSLAEKNWFGEVKHRKISEIELLSKHVVDEECDESLAVQMGLNLIMKRFPQQRLQKECVDTTTLSLILQKISLSIVDATQLISDLKYNCLSRNHHLLFNVKSNEVVMKVSSLKAFIKFDLTFCIEASHYPKDIISWNFKNYIGEVSTEDIEQLVQGVKTGYGYFKRLIQTMVQFVQEKERVRIFSK